ncbi:MAG: cytochrome c [Chloroflexota bacterium]
MRKIILCLSLMMILTACGSSESSITLAELPDTGDAVNGEALFSEYNCNACHVEGASGAPNLDDLADRADSIVAGQSAREYTFYAIVEPSQHIAEGYGNAMPNNYDDRMTPQEIADLVAYLLDS